MKKIVKNYYNQALDALTKFISFPSVHDESTIEKNKPFGQGVSEALNYIGSLAEQFGFDVDYCDGYVTEISIGNKGNLICIYGHADVVPVGDGWMYNPFTLTKYNNNLYGRGAIDDKGPVIAAFYALKALKDNKLLPECRIKLIVGGNEERGSACLDYYHLTLKREYPKFGFTPDAEFPLIYGEKAIGHYNIVLKLKNNNIISCNGGVALNVGIDKVNVVLKKDLQLEHELLNRTDIEIISCDDSTKISFLGKACHASMPELGDNAFLKACNVLGLFYNDSQLMNIYNMFKDVNGRDIPGYHQGEVLGKTTYCIGVVSSNEKGELTFSLDHRFPEGYDVKITLETIKSKLNASVVTLSEDASLVEDVNSKWIQTILKSYQKETNDMTEAFTIGGGTYAKHTKNTIAVGPQKLGTNYNLHDIDEYIPEHEFYDLIRIYARIIKNLGDINEN